MVRLCAIIFGLIGLIFLGNQIYLNGIIKVGWYSSIAGIFSTLALIYYGITGKHEDDNKNFSSFDEGFYVIGFILLLAAVIFGFVVLTFAD